MPILFQDAAEPRKCFLSLGAALIAGILPFCSSGCKPNTPAPPRTENVEVPAGQAEPAPEQPAEPRPVLTKRWTQEVVDLQKAQAENPKLVEVENKITGTDPLTTSLQGYIAISSRANVLNFQHQVNLMKAAEDRNPTYDEIMTLIKQTKMEFNALPDYQTYAYDQQAGKFTILEDPDAKAKFEQQAN